MAACWREGQGEQKWWSSYLAGEVDFNGLDADILGTGRHVDVVRVGFRNAYSSLRVG